MSLNGEKNNTQHRLIAYKEMEKAKNIEFMQHYMYLHSIILKQEEQELKQDGIIHNILFFSGADVHKLWFQLLVGDAANFGIDPILSIYRAGIANANINTFNL